MALSKFDFKSALLPEASSAMNLAISSSNTVRVCQLISQLHYNDLVASGIVPDLTPFTPTLPKKRYPPWLYALSKSNSEIFCDFGLFIEEVIYTAIIGAPMNYTELWSRVCRSDPPDSLNKSSNYFGGIMGTFRPMFKGHQVHHGITLAHSKDQAQIEGHPDFFCDNFMVGTQRQTWIIDVKTTTGFNTARHAAGSGKPTTMAHETFLQILAYSALTRANGHINNYIGVLLPVQRQILWYDVSDWNSQPYLNLLLRESAWVLDDYAVLEYALAGVYQHFTSLKCGTHVPKDQLLDCALESNGRPLQIFLSNPRGKTITPDHNIAALAQELPQDVSIFVHAPYIINLCNQYDDAWSINHLRQELRIAATLNCKGVVVHVGKYTNMPIDQALNVMEQQMRQILAEATPDCPLILETPAGQGTELCVPIDQLMNFYRRFDNTPNLRICVDSCHVFAAGYDPVWYLQQWLNQLPDSVILMHFNDSEVPRGARVDRHAIPGLGYIGYDRMHKLHDLCVDHNIPMVRE